MILTQCSFIFHRRMGGSAASKHFGKYNLGKKTPIYHDGARQVIKKQSSKLTKGINFHDIVKLQTDWNDLQITCYLPMPDSLYGVRLQGIVVDVFIKPCTRLSNDEYNYPESLQARAIEGIGH